MFVGLVLKIVESLFPSCLAIGVARAGDLIFFPIYTMELCEKKRNIDIMGCRMYPICCYQEGDKVLPRLSRQQDRFRT